MTVTFDANPEPLRAYRVLMRPDEGPSWWVRVPAAIGPYDAKNQARQQVLEAGEEATPITVSLEDPIEPAWKDRGYTDSISIWQDEGR